MQTSKNSIQYAVNIMQVFAIIHLLALESAKFNWRNPVLPQCLHRVRALELELFGKGCPIQICTESIGGKIHRGYWASWQTWNQCFLGG